LRASKTLWAGEAWQISMPSLSSSPWVRAPARQITHHSDIGADGVIEQSDLRPRIAFTITSHKKRGFPGPVAKILTILLLPVSLNQTKNIAWMRGQIPANVLSVIRWGARSPSTRGRNGFAGTRRPLPGARRSSASIPSCVPWKDDGKPAGDRFPISTPTSSPRRPTRSICRSSRRRPGASSRPRARPRRGPNVVVSIKVTAVWMGRGVEPPGLIPRVSHLGAQRPHPQAHPPRTPDHS